MSPEWREKLGKIDSRERVRVLLEPIFRERISLGSLTGTDLTLAKLWNSYSILSDKEIGQHLEAKGCPANAFEMLMKANFGGLEAFYFLGDVPVIRNASRLLLIGVEGMNEVVSGRHRLNLREPVVDLALAVAQGRKLQDRAFELVPGYVENADKKLAMAREAILWQEIFVPVNELFKV